MCLAVPGRVVALEGLMARVAFVGVEYTVFIDLVPDIRVGEYVLVHAGFAIQRLHPEEAMETLALLDEVAEAASEPGPAE